MRSKKSNINIIIYIANRIYDNNMHRTANGQCKSKIAMEKREQFFLRKKGRRRRRRSRSSIKRAEPNTNKLQRNSRTVRPRKKNAFTVFAVLFVWNRAFYFNSQWSCFSHTVEVLGDYEVLSKRVDLIHVLYIWCSLMPLVEFEPYALGCQFFLRLSVQ